MVDALRAAGCVFAEDEAAALRESAQDPRELARLVARRVTGEPLEQVLGYADFGGLRVAVAPGVFVPRRRTELLAREALRVLSGSPAPTLVELCCGCGAVSAVVAAALPDTLIHASDLDPAAVACARRNLPGAGVAVGDLDAAVPAELAGRVGALVANTPYVPTADILGLPREARDHEPMLALDGGPDGLALARQVMTLAPRWLAPEGVVIVETSRAQAPELSAAARAAGLKARTVHWTARAATAVLGRLP